MGIAYATKINFCSHLYHIYYDIILRDKATVTNDLSFEFHGMH